MWSKTDIWGHASKTRPSRCLGLAQLPARAARGFAASMSRPTSYNLPLAHAAAPASAVAVRLRWWPWLRRCKFTLLTLATATWRPRWLAVHPGVTLVGGGKDVRRCHDKPQGRAFGICGWRLWPSLRAGEYQKRWLILEAPLPRAERCGGESLTSTSGAKIADTPRARRTPRTSRTWTRPGSAESGLSCVPIGTQLISFS